MLVASAGLTLDLDVTYLLVLALLLVPLLALNGLIFQPFLKLFADRHEQLEGALVRTQAKLAEAEERAKAFDARIQVATSKGIDARNKLRAEATAKMNELVEAERVRLASKLEGALSDLKKSRLEALADVHVEASKLAETTAMKLLGRGF